MAKKDVFLKDEGEIITVIFESDAAHKALEQQPDEVKKHVTTGKALDGSKVSKLDIMRESLLHIQAWLVSHNLSWEQDV